jgi:hypothetical protein
MVPRLAAASPPKSIQVAPGPPTGQRQGDARGAVVTHAAGLDIHKALMVATVFTPTDTETRSGPTTCWRWGPG